MTPTYVIIIGAGCTVSDSQEKNKLNKPPLDNGFFQTINKKYNDEIQPIYNFFHEHYDIDESDDIFNSLENLMATLFTDISSPTIGDHALTTFKRLVRLYNRLLAKTTNNLVVS